MRRSKLNTIETLILKPNDHMSSRKTFIPIVSFITIVISIFFIAISIKPKLSRPTTILMIFTPIIVGGGD